MLLEYAVHARNMMHSVKVANLILGIMLFHALDDLLSQ